MLSRQFIERLKLSDQPAYRLALKVGLNPSSLYKWTRRIQNPKSGDTRLLKIGRLLGLQDEDIFETQEKAL